MKCRMPGRLSPPLPAVPGPGGGPEPGPGPGGGAWALPAAAAAAVRSAAISAATKGSKEGTALPARKGSQNRKWWEKSRKGEGRNRKLWEPEPEAEEEGAGSGGGAGSMEGRNRKWC